MRLAATWACVLLAGCDRSHKPAPDAARDAATDGPNIDSSDQCLSRVDCSDPTPRCCIGCSPAGACSNAFCQAPSGNFCAYALCDPSASSPCLTPAGTQGTCQQTQLSIYDHRVYWVCE